jgi:hypothetical protein
MTEQGYSFGDIVVNGYAGEDHPRRRGIVVRQAYHTGPFNSGPYIELTDGKGIFWRCMLSNDRLEKVGSLFCDNDLAVALDRKYMAQQCYHEGCQRREAEVKRLKDRVACLEAFLRSVIDGAQSVFHEHVSDTPFERVDKTG